MPNEILLNYIRDRVAVGSIPASTVRNMGPGGTMAAVQAFLRKAEVLSSFCECENEDSFQSTLDEQTESLRKILPISDDGHRGRHWGTARKCLNIFLYECVLNRHLCDASSRLVELESWLEVPLDNLVAEGLRREPHGNGLPRWDAVIRLTPLLSEKYQQVARVAAINRGISRVHLDAYLYVPETFRVSS